MLQLITGGSGCGKTRYTRQQLCSLAAEGKSPVLIVPEQYSFESERAMLSMLGAKDARRVRVYSFTRLAEDVARKAGGSAGRRLDDCGRVAAMGLVLSQLSGELSYYKGKRSSHFIEHLLDAVKEFKLCALEPQELYRAANAAGGRLREKLTELALIYGAYNAITAQTAPVKGEGIYDRLLSGGLYDRLPGQASLDPMDDLDRLYDQLGEIRFFDGATVYIDSFRGYTGQELRVLSRIMQQAELCAVTVCLERSGSTADEGSGLFATAIRTAGQLRAVAEECGCRLLPEVTLAKRHRFASEPLEMLESSLFRREDDRLTYDGSTDAVTLYEASDRYDELEFCARECRRLVREEGYRCRDIAIIARSEDTYASIAADALAQQRLPCFADLRVDASGSALMRFVLAALEAADGGLRTADMLRCVKTGMIDGIDATDIAELENYCFIWNVPKGGWEQPFEQHPDGMGARSTEDTDARLERINAARERLCSLILPLRAALRSERAADMCAAVYELVDASGTAQCLERLSEGLSATAAAELPQLWDLLISVLEQLCAILGDSTCRADEFIAYINLMIKRADVGHIPHGLDEITFGGADRLRVNAPRAVFVVGALEGEFPAVPGSAGVFTDEERRRLRDELGVQVAQTADTKLLEERLLVYNALSAASERLYITWPAVGGERTGRSEFIDEVTACVPGCTQLSHDDMPDAHSVGSAEAAFELYARSLGSGDEISASLGAALSERPDWTDRVRAVEEAHRGDLPAPLGQEGARQLFGSDMQLSASRAETYHQCRYRFFCRYGLDLQPRRRAELDGMEYGTVAHYVLEHIFRETSDFAALAADAQNVAERISALIERYLAEQLGGEQGKTAGFLYRLRAMRGSLTALVLNLAAELSGSDFTPVSYELRIGENAPVKPRVVEGSGELKGHLVGSIDRVDRCEIGGREYLRVIDYKTGRKVFRLSDVLAGLNMQMIIYLSELCASSEDAQPAGLLYCPAFSGCADGGRITSEEIIASERDKALRRKGVIIEQTEHLPADRPAEDTDLPVSRAMEQSLGGRFIPVTLLRSGKTAGMLSSQARSSVVSSEQFELIGRYVRRTLGKMLDTVDSGQLPPDPADTGFAMCESCDYYPVCRYAGEVRPLEKCDTAGALEIMTAILDEGGEQQ
ncbi:MAG: hypothetical protein E7554_08655 [Ruminococcaceae bacterium]|nr:hypothetical protein [Oscillospiraceae bacterium]